jgi:hypothetical protein
MNNAGYEVFYGGGNMTGQANPFSWKECAKVIKFHKRNKQIKYIFCIGPYGGGRRLIYRALRGVPGWCAANKAWPKLMVVPMQLAETNPPISYMPRAQIESD